MSEFREQYLIDSKCKSAKRHISGVLRFSEDSIPRNFADTIEGRTFCEEGQWMQLQIYWEFFAKITRYLTFIRCSFILCGADKSVASLLRSCRGHYSSLRPSHHPAIIIHQILNYILGPGSEVPCKSEWRKFLDAGASLGLSF